MKNLILSVLLLLAIGGPRLMAATNVVIVGADFQAAVNAAAPGDIMVAQSGVYNGNVSISKALTIVCSGVGGISLPGNTTISGTGAVAFVQTTFQGSLTVQTNATLTLSQCSCPSTFASSGGTLQAYDTQFSGSVSATGGKLTLKRCQLSVAVNITSAAFEGLRVTNSSTIAATAPAGSGLRFMLVQSSVPYVNATGYNVWLGYDTFAAIGMIDCNSVMIGDRLNPGNPAGDNDIVHVLRGTIRACNNTVTVNTDNGTYRGFVGFNLDTTSGEIVNNTMYFNSIQNTAGILVRARGILVTGAGGTTVVRGTVFAIPFQAFPAGYTDRADIEASQPQLVDISYCDLYTESTSSLIGATAANSIYDNPQFNGDLTLTPGSPALHAGPPDAIYNNTDGSRNTMGYTGGPLWKPANYTNDNPMVFWLLPTNQIVLKGVQSTIQFGVGASAGH